MNKNNNSIVKIIKLHYSVTGFIKNIDILHYGRTICTASSTEIMDQNNIIIGNVKFNATNTISDNSINRIENVTITVVCNLGNFSIDYVCLTYPNFDTFTTTENNFRCKLTYANGEFTNASYVDVIYIKDFNGNITGVFLDIVFTE